MTDDTRQTVGGHRTRDPVPKTSPNGNKAKRGAPKGNANARKHGLTTMKRAMKELGSRAIDGRSAVGKEASRFRRELIDDLGGPETVNTQQLAVVDAAVMSRIIVQSIGAWILQNDSVIIDKRKKRVRSIVMQWDTLKNSYTKHFTELGLKRVPKDARDLTQLLSGDES